MTGCLSEIETASSGIQTISLALPAVVEYADER
jgi:hypothetical protein